MGVRTISKTIDLSQLPKESKYITEINDTGITIHPKVYNGSTSIERSSYIQLDGTGMELFNSSGISIAKYGEDIRLGNVNEGKLLITAGGQGHTYEDAGTYIIDGNDNVVAQFTSDGVQIGQTNGGHSIVDVNGMRVYGGYNNALIAHIGFTNSYKRYYTFGEREDNSTIGNYSHAEGKGVVASGAYSHAEGFDTAATDTSAHAEGYYTSATGYGSHAEGFTNFTTSTRTNGIVANNYGAHAEGYAANNPSYSIKATGLGAHAEGNAAISDIIASGDGAHVEGSGTKASGDYSHAQNKGTEVAYEAQTALGQYNSNQSTNALEIGNGTADNARSNALTVDWNGNVEIAGTLTQSKGRAYRKYTNSTSIASGGSVSFNVEVTTYGGPVLLAATCCWNGDTNGAWSSMYISRGTTVLTQTTMVSTTASHNCPGAVVYVDEVAAGTYTYTCTLVSGSGAGTFSENNGGRSEAPVLCAIEL